jgi:hypothetical protein
LIAEVITRHGSGRTKATCWVAKFILPPLRFDVSLLNPKPFI